MLLNSFHTCCLTSPTPTPTHPAPQHTKPRSEREKGKFLWGRFSMFLLDWQIGVGFPINFSPVKSDFVHTADAHAPAAPHRAGGGWRKPRSRGCWSPCKFWPTNLKQTISAAPILVCFLGPFTLSSCYMTISRLSHSASFLV